MPPKPKITREMIIDAAFDIAREDGSENINARTVAKKLKCSTQPVMYHFKTIEELKKAVYIKADNYHTNYILKVKKSEKGIMTEVGINYISFSMEEPNLFRFLFQSGFIKYSSVTEMNDSEELLPIITSMQKALNMNVENTKKVFLSIAMFLHGYASMIANNSLKYNEEQIALEIHRAYRGAILAVKEEIT